MTRRKVLAGGAVVVATLVLLQVLWKERSVPIDLPDAEEVSSMQASLHNSPKSMPDVPLFDVPASHIGQVLAALSPAVRDEHPAKWQHLGELSLSCKNGRRLRVELFSTSHGSGAFAVEDPARVYCRGGSNAAIEQAIRAAYAVATNRPKKADIKSALHVR
jgi:hypothetical protein